MHARLYLVAKQNGRYLLKGAICNSSIPRSKFEFNTSLDVFLGPLIVSSRAVRLNGRSSGTKKETDSRMANSNKIHMG